MMDISNSYTFQRLCSSLYQTEQILVDPVHGGYGGASVVMIRQEDIDLCTDSRPVNKKMKREDMKNRAGMTEQANADMVFPSI